MVFFFNYIILEICQLEDAKEKYNQNIPLDTHSNEKVIENCNKTKEKYDRLSENKNKCLSNEKEITKARNTVNYFFFLIIKINTL